MIFHNINVLLYFDQINAAFMMRKKYLKILLTPNFFFLWLYITIILHAALHSIQ